MSDDHMAGVTGYPLGVYQYLAGMHILSLHIFLFILEGLYGFTQGHRDGIIPSRIALSGVS